MAELIPTAIQEELSIDYFKTFLDNNWDVSDTKYQKLLSDSWGAGGKFPFSNFGRTDKGYDLGIPPLGSSYNIHSTFIFYLLIFNLFKNKIIL